MQQNLSVEPLPQFASQQEGSAHGAEASGIPQPLCGAFDPTNGFLLVGSATGAVTCIHLGRYGSVARRILGRHAGRVTSACVLPWRPPAAASAKSTGRPASFFATCSADATINLWTSDAKALHTTDPCLQTLRGHKAAITSLAAVQVRGLCCHTLGDAPQRCVRP
jgi:WD40 repeat protein